MIEEADHGKQQSALVPLLLDPVKPPFGFGDIQAADLAGWNGDEETESFWKLYQDIILHLGSPTPAAILEPETATDPPAIHPPRSETDSARQTLPIHSTRRLNRHRLANYPRMRAGGVALDRPSMSTGRTPVTMLSGCRSKPVSFVGCRMRPSGSTPPRRDKFRILLAMAQRENKRPSGTYSGYGKLRRHSAGGF